jgi:hypothetical protein
MTEGRNHLRLSNICLPRTVACSSTCPEDERLCEKRHILGEPNSHYHRVGKDRVHVWV